MSKFRLWSAALVFDIAACGGAPKPEAQLSSSEGAIRGAKEAGADTVPDATLHVKLAEEERAKAVELIAHGENHRGAMMLARAEADAELAVALSRAANAKVDADKASDTVDALKQKAAQ